MNISINSQNETNKTASGGSSSVPVFEEQNKNQNQGFWATVKTAFAWGLGGGFGGSIGWALGQAVVKFFGKIFKFVWLGIASWLALHGIQSFTNDAAQHYAKAPQAQIQKGVQK